VSRLPVQPTVTSLKTSVKNGIKTVSMKPAFKPRHIPNAKNEKVHCLRQQYSAYSGNKLRTPEDGEMWDRPLQIKKRKEI
jgi:hypothetical protein